MANADQLKALIRSHAQGEDERFYAIALQVAAQAARRGQTKFARELRDLVDEARQQRAAAAVQEKLVPMARPRGELADPLIVAYPDVRLKDMFLDEAVAARIRRLLKEQRHRSKLRGYGLEPMRKLLLTGPPGTGKSMTARAIAGELGLPLYTVRIERVISKYLGETAAKLRLVFDALSQSRGVYFFDEFDALGGERGDRSDVGEMRRTLNAFLQFVEADTSDSLIIAATNHPRLLDRALFRRFDEVIEYPLPTPELADQMVQSQLALFDTSAVNWETLKTAYIGLSQADIARAVQSVMKTAIIDDRKVVYTEELLEAFRERKNMQM